VGQSGSQTDIAIRRQLEEHLSVALGDLEGLDESL
jgi:hypothetical protein